MKEIRKRYNKETGKGMYTNPLKIGRWCFTIEYVHWLETQLETKLTEKQLETKIFVEQYIQENNKPPTYRIIAKKFNIPVSAAYARLKHNRNLMRTNMSTEEYTI